MMLSSEHVDALQRERAFLKRTIQGRADQAFGVWHIFDDCLFSLRSIP
jgi:hypothetical protein